MQALGRPWKYRATLSGIVAYCQNHVERMIPKLIEMLRAMVADVYAILGHGLDGQRMDCRGLKAGAHDLDWIPGQMAYPALGHLGASRVARTQDEHPPLHFSCLAGGVSIWRRSIRMSRKWRRIVN